MLGIGRALHRRNIGRIGRKGENEHDSAAVAAAAALSLPFDFPDHLSLPLPMPLPLPLDMDMPLADEQTAEIAGDSAFDTIGGFFDVDACEWS